jgi:hypothetical protein
MNRSYPLLVAKFDEIVPALVLRHVSDFLAGSNFGNVCTERTLNLSFRTQSDCLSSNLSFNSICCYRYPLK